MTIYIINFIVVAMGLSIAIGILVYLSNREEKRGYLDTPVKHQEQEENIIKFNN
jgi:hypothetical protein